MKKQILAMTVAAAIATPAMAQSMNIDIDSTMGTPLSTYGAAAGQAGFWNSITGAAAGQTFNLSDLSGGATSAVWTNVTGNALFSSSIVPINPEHVALMRDGFDLGGGGATDTFTISGLTDGTYDVYVYAWAPDTATFTTGVSVNGAPQVAVGGTPPGGDLAVGVTHALFTGVSVAGGTITINTATLSGFSTINGVQLVIPAPGAMALLGLAGLVGSRRRRG